MAEHAPLLNNLLLVDADFADQVAFGFTVNFERMLERRVERADLADWLECLALDGGLRPAEQQVQCVFIHPKPMEAFKCFAPARFADELDGKAFAGRLGEFLLQSVAVEPMVEKGELFCQCLHAACHDKGVERLMVVADMDAYGDRVKQIVADADHKDVTLFALQPLTGRGFAQELLSYSLVHALGVSADELPGQ